MASISMLNLWIDLVKQIDEITLRDEFFNSRKLYQNVDFDSGISFRSIGFPVKGLTCND